MSGTEFKVEGTDPLSIDRTPETTISELLNVIRDLKQQREDDMKRFQDDLKKQREDDMKRFQDMINQTKRRSTMYVPNTPHRVNDRTSMGGIANMKTSLSSEYDYEEVDPLLDEVDRSLNKNTTMKVKEPPVFDGHPNSDVTRWLELMEDFMSCFSESEVMKVQKVMLYLGEGPRIYVKTAEQEAKSEGRPFYWKDVKKTLLECFLPTITEDIARARLALLKQTGSVAEYTLEFQKLDRHIPSSDAADRIDRYRRGLKEQIQRLWLQQTTLQSVAKAAVASAKGEATPTPIISKLTEAISYAAQLEASIGQYRELSKATYGNSLSTAIYRPSYGSYQQADQRRKPAAVNQVATAYGDGSYADIMDLDGAWDGHQYQQGGVGGLNQVNATPLSRPRPVKPRGMSEEKYEKLMKEKKCLVCEQVGHRRVDCPKVQASASSGGSGGSQSVNSSSKMPKKEDAPRQ
jgi:hypothetical protein